MKKALLIISHGSHSSKLVDEIKILVHSLKSIVNFPIAEYAFLEITTPDIPTGIKNCVDQGADEIKILLNFLNSGRHVNQDIPKIVEDTQKKFPHIKISISQPIGQHKQIPHLFADLV